MSRLKLWMFPAFIIAALASAGAASAQVVVQYDDPNYDDRDRGPPVIYRDYRRDFNPDYRVRTYDDYSLRPSGPNGCGTYYFWNGVRCVDARYR
jgi:hypothetical protein